MGAAPAEAFLTYGARAAFLLFLVWGLYNPLRALLMSRTVGVRVTRGLPAALVRRGIISSHDTSNQDALASLIAIVTPWEIRSRIGSGIGSLIGILLGSLFALPLFLDPGHVLK